MKKEYLKNYDERAFSIIITINMMEHDGRLEPTSLNDDDLEEIKSCMTAKEHYALREKSIDIKDDKNLTTIKKLYKRGSNSYIYLVAIQYNKYATVNKSYEEYYIREVKR